MATSTTAASPMSHLRIVIPSSLTRRLPVAGRSNRDTFPRPSTCEQALVRDVEGEGDRAGQLRLFTEHGHLDPRPERRQRPELPLNRPSERVRVPTDPAPQDHELGIEHGDDRSDPDGDPLCNGSYSLACSLVPVPGGLEDFGRARDAANPCAPCGGQNAVGPDSRLEGSPAAVRLVVRVRGREREVRDLARRTVRALEQLAAHDDPESHARSYVEIDEIVDIAPQPAPALADRGEVDVVLEHDPGRELLPDLIEDTLARPARKVVCEQGVSGRTEHAGTPDHGHRHPAPADPRGFGGRACDTADRLDQRARGPCSGGLPTLRHDLPSEVGDRCADVLATDVDTDAPSSGGVQLVQPRR